MHPRAYRVAAPSPRHAHLFQGGMGGVAQMQRDGRQRLGMHIVQRTPNHHIAGVALGQGRQIDRHMCPR